MAAAPRNRSERQRKKSGCTCRGERQRKNNAGACRGAAARGRGRKTAACACQRRMAEETAGRACSRPLTRPGGERSVKSTGSDCGGGGRAVGDYSMLGGGWISAMHCIGTGCSTRAEGGVLRSSGGRQPSATSHQEITHHHAATQKVVHRARPGFSPQGQGIWKSPAAAGGSARWQGLRRARPAPPLHVTAAFGGENAYTAVRSENAFEGRRYGTSRAPLRRLGRECAHVEARAARPHRHRRRPTRPRPPPTWPGTQIWDISCCCHPLTGVPCLRFGPRTGDSISRKMWSG